MVPSRPPESAGAALFVNRELSFLAFNRRVLDEAADPAVPLLERLKFASIVGANLDEFFMVRVAGLKQQLKSGVLEAGPDGMLPREQLDAVREQVAEQVEAQEQVVLRDILPSLRSEGVGLLHVDELDEGARENLAERFEREVFPMLTPLAVDPGHPFPMLKNRSLDLAIHLLPIKNGLEAPPLLAVVQIPSLLPRFIEVTSPRHEIAFVCIEDLIRTHVGLLFPGMRILEAVPFRVIRNWDLSFDEDEQEDLLETIQKELKRRWQLDAVRLEISGAASPTLQDRLRRALELEPEDVGRYRGPLALADFEGWLSRIGRADLRDVAFEPVLNPELAGDKDIFSTIGRSDILLHHPYESYEPVLDLLESAAEDPRVLAIKQTLYRMNRGSPLLGSLIRAAQNGKQVTALVELKARFHEELNVEWARALEEAGVHVVYGMIGLKTHCKVTMVVRRETSGVRRYVHLGTGNYNERTAKVYSDLSFFTARDDVGRDMAALFNILTGYSAPPRWEKLVVAPLDLRRRLLERIEEARAVAVAGRPAKIIFKTNALIDREIAEALAVASRAGVEVVLLVRGPCTLRPGLEDRTDRIQVRMIIDRFLEHSRLFYFAHDGQESVFITSTDVMHRNFDRRIEVMLPVEDERLKRRLIDEIIALELADDTKSSVLGPDGLYRRLRAGTVRAQQRFMELARARAAAASRGPRRESVNGSEGRPR
ncbi:MAG: polyphosphate kinase 1 [Myxococcota bacterium]